MANGIVLGGKLKFRKKASTSGTVITSIPTGTVLSVSAVSGNDSWYQTTYSTYGTGYVMKSFVAVASDTVEVNATNVNVRNSANGSTVLYTLSSPATATVQDVSSDWVKIQPSGKKVGWIKADYVNKKSSGSSSSGGNSSGGGSSSSSDLVGKSGMVAVNASGLNVRSSANGSLLSYKLYNGEKVTILEVSTAGGYTWYRVQDSQNRTNGWVRSDFIAVDNTSGGGSSSSSDLVGKSGMVAVNASGLNVRSSANGSLLSYKLYNGEKVTILEVSTAGGYTWYRVQDSQNRTNGWVRSDFIAVDNTSGGGSSSSSDLVGKSGMVAVNASGLNVRSSANGSLLSYKLYNGEKVTILEVSTAGGYTWYRVQDSQNRTNGWVRSDFIAVDNTSGGGSSSSSDLVGKSGMVAVNASGLNVRSSANGSLLSYKLYNGEKVTILEVSTAGGYTWYRVQDSQNRTNGWVRSDFIAVDNTSGGTTENRVLGTSFDGYTTDAVSSYVTIRSRPRASSADIHHFEVTEVMTFYTFTGVGTVAEQRQWLYVDHGAFSGYVCARYIGGGANSFSGNARVNESQGVYLRLLPSTSADRIALLPFDSYVKILDTSVANWYRVASVKGTGWVSADCITLKK